MSEPIFLVHPITGGQYQAVNEDQAAILARAGWVRGDNAANARRERLAQVKAELGELEAAESSAREQATVEPDQDAGEQDKTTVAELQEQLRQLGKPVSGTKQELIERLEQARAENETREQ